MGFLSASSSQMIQTFRTSNSTEETPSTERDRSPAKSLSRRASSTLQKGLSRKKLRDLGDMKEDKPVTVAADHLEGEESTAVTPRFFSMRDGGSTSNKTKRMSVKDIQFSPRRSSDGPEEFDPLNFANMTPEDRDTLNELRRIQLGAPELPKELSPRASFRFKYTVVRGERAIAPIDQSTRKNLLAVFREMVETEREFEEKMKMVCDHFLVPVRERDLLSGFQTSSLFSNLEQILQCSQKLLRDLEMALTLGQEDSGVIPMFAQWAGQIFSFHAPLMLPIYSTYCSNQPTIDSLYDEYKEIPKFGAFLRAAYRNPACQKQDLKSFLIRPLQRLCKYPLLLRELVKLTSDSSPEMESLQSGYQLICQSVDSVNLKVKQVENLTKLAEINMELTNGSEYREITLNPAHEFISKQYLIINGEIRNLYMFNHFLLICRQTPVDQKMHTRKQGAPEYTILHALALHDTQLDVDSSKPQSPRADSDGTPGTVPIDGTTSGSTAKLIPLNVFVMKCEGLEFTVQCKDALQKKKLKRQLERLIEAAPHPSAKPAAPNMRSRTITLVPLEEKKRSKNPLLARIGEQRSELSPSKSSAEVEKLQSMLKTEQIRRKIEEDNTATFKSMYEELLEKHRTETSDQQRKIAELESLVSHLQEQLEQAHQGK